MHKIQIERLVKFFNFYLFPIYYRIIVGTDGFTHNKMIKLSKEEYDMIYDHYTGILGPSCTEEMIFGELGFLFNDSGECGLSYEINYKKSAELFVEKTRFGLECKERRGRKYWHFKKIIKHRKNKNNQQD